MSEYDLKLKPEDLVGLLTEDASMGELLTNVLNQVLDAQCTEQLQAKRFERSEERQGYRNGYRPRTLYSRVGPLHLRVPQTREGHFSTELFARYQRSEKALVLSLMEMYLQGVSTRKVTRITEELCGASFSKSQVSQLCTQLDSVVGAWQGRSLKDYRYPFLIVDALVVDVRRDGCVRSTGVLIAYGVNEQGQREPLDLLVADSESETSWNELFSRLKSRGLQGVDLVVSDAHKGLVLALKKQFQGASWQRCQTHFIRNILGHAPRHIRGELADALKLIFTAHDADTARKLIKELIHTYQDKAYKAMEVLEDGFEQALTILTFPKTYRQKLRTSNLAERMNEEIRRRQRVLRIFPNEEAAKRLIGALLNEFYEQWKENNKYLDMTEYWDWCSENKLNFNAANMVAIKA